jgi:hypothetical protein
VLAELAAEVVTIERIPELAERARATLADVGYGNVEVMVGDGSLGGARARAVRRHRRRRGSSDDPSSALTTSSPKAVVSSSPRLAVRAGPRSRRADTRRPDRTHVDPLSLRPARGDEGFGEN